MSLCLGSTFGWMTTCTCMYVQCVYFNPLPLVLYHRYQSHTIMYYYPPPPLSLPPISPPPPLSPLPPPPQSAVCSVVQCQVPGVDQDGGQRVFSGELHRRHLSEQLPPQVTTSQERERQKERRGSTGLVQTHCVCVHCVCLSLLPAASTMRCMPS